MIINQNYRELFQNKERKIILIPSATDNDSVT